MREVLAVDPGNILSGTLIYVPEDPELPVRQPGKIHNVEVAERIQAFAKRIVSGECNGVVVIEFPQPRGQLASKELFKMVFWVGRFYEIGRNAGLTDATMQFMDRLKVKGHLCHSASAKDKQVRQAVIDRFDGQDATRGPRCRNCKGNGGWGRGKARKQCDDCEGTGEVTPGPLFGVHDDIWQALALAIAYHEKGETLNIL